MKVQTVDLAGLTLDPHNANDGTERGRDMLSTSLSTDGAGRSLLVDADLHVIAGNQTLAAALAAGYTEAVIVPSDGTRLVVVQRTDVGGASATRARLAVADNRVGEINLVWNPAALDRLGEIIDLSPFEFDDLPQLDIDEPTGDPDAVPAVESVEVSKVGDLWCLGDHRILCGDSTHPEQVERLMGGREIGFVCTDPPYGISVVGRGAATGGGGQARRAASRLGSLGGDAERPEGGMVFANRYAPVEGDGDTLAATAFIKGVMRSTPGLVWGANHFASALPDSRCWLVWDKKGREWNDTFSDFEMAWTSADRPAKIFTHVWMGMVQSGEREARVHPTQKPAKLITRCLDYVDASGIILDGFLGSGSTLIACEDAGRVCYAVELSPAYVDVAIRRWQESTGLSATLDGETFDEATARGTDPAE